VTKAEVIAAIADKTGISKDDVSTIVEKFFDVIKKTMEDGENVYIRGFGSFINKYRARKVARNITKNTAMIIDAHFVPSFKPARIFNDKIKNSLKLKAKLKSNPKP